MSKRPTIDLMALTSAEATPMAEAPQRSAAIPVSAPMVAEPPQSAPEPRKRSTAAGQGRKASPDESTRTENLEPMNFKVPAEFRKRFRKAAAEADVKLNELLFDSFATWEKQQAHKA